MNYFEAKAQELNDKLRSARRENQQVTIGEVEKIMEMALREVALDQKYQAIRDVEHLKLNPPYEALDPQYDHFEYIENCIKSSSLEK
jgi:hypothetical protein